MVVDCRTLAATRHLLVVTVMSRPICFLPSRGTGSKERLEGRWGRSDMSVWGCGDKDSLQRQYWVNACHLLSRALSATKAKHIAFAADFKTPKTVPNSWALQQISTQLTRGNYRYTTTKKSAAKGLCPIEKISFLNHQKTFSHHQKSHFLSGDFWQYLYLFP